MFKILPNYALPHFNIPGCMFAWSISFYTYSCFWVQLRLACSLVLNWFRDLSMPFLKGFVLSMQTVPQTTLEPAVESGISGVTFVCVVFLFSTKASWCFYLAAKGNTISVIPGHGTACTPSCVCLCLWIRVWAELRLLWCLVFLGCPLRTETSHAFTCQPCKCRV